MKMNDVVITEAKRTVGTTATKTATKTARDTARRFVRFWKGARASIREATVRLRGRVAAMRQGQPLLRIRANQQAASAITNAQIARALGNSRGRPRTKR